MEQQQLTVKEALEQGYTMYTYESNDEYDNAKYITDIAIDKEKRSDLVLLEKNSQSPSIDGESLAELIAEHVENNHCSESGDDSNLVYEIIIKMNFDNVADRINEELKKVKYFMATDIKLVKE